MGRPGVVCGCLVRPRQFALAVVLLLTARASTGLASASQPWLPLSAGSTWRSARQLIMQVPGDPPTPSASQQPPSPDSPPPAQTGHVVAWGSNKNLLGFPAGQLNVPPEALVNVTAVAGGVEHSLALLNTGKVLAWGYNSSYEISVPAAALSDVMAIEAGLSFSMALLMNRTVLAWGSNIYGQLEVPPAARSGVVQISAGYSHALALLINGSVVGWGWDNFGQATVPVAAQSGVLEVAAGRSHSVARLSNGTVIAWGSNDLNQTNIPAAALVGVAEIAAGHFHSLARLSDGQVVAWGSNINNQTNVPEGLKGVVALAAGANHNLALLASGSVVAWGQFTSPQEASSMPPEAMANVVTIAAGASHSLAVVKGAASSPSPPAFPSPSATGEPTSSSSGVPIGAIVGGVVGGVALLAVVVGGFAYRAKRRRAQLRSCELSFQVTTATGQGMTGGSGIGTSLTDLYKANNTATLSPNATSNVLPATNESADSARRRGSNGSPGLGMAPTRLLSTAASITTSGTRYEKALMSEVRIPWESIKIGRVLGMGGFGTVSRGMWQGNAVAVKMLNVDLMSDTARNELRRETLMMCTLRHPCIATVYGLVDDDNHTALVMRYYPRGTVAAAMHKPEYSNLSESHRLQMALQVASGMCFLHGKGILHGDLKTSNLLVEDTATGVVLADFGLSCMAGQAVTSGALTVSISPPEVLEQPTAPRTPAGDVYAFSIVLLEIYTGNFTYKGIRSQQVKDLVCDGRRPTIPATVPDSVAAVIKACWAQEAASRPAFAEVMKLLEAASSAKLEQEAAEYENVHGQQGHTTRPAYTLADLTSTQT